MCAVEFINVRTSVKKFNSLSVDRWQHKHC